ncbi:MAG: LURP-one-related family protein [Bacilli bacterium]|nr:LURP-one-related family protein [Bacilli bacterium]
MELSIRNKWISLRGSSVVQDLEGNDVLRVQGKFFTFTRKKLVMDLNDNLKYTVRNKFWFLFRRKSMIYDADGNEVVRLSRKVLSLHDHYFVTSNLGEMEIVGNIFQFNYKITLNGKEIGHIARKISLRDSYVLTIDDNFDYMLFVAMVIAIDNITDQRDSDRSSSWISVNDND